MSTRATYNFKDAYGVDVTFYIHHDGYPEGAAEYLCNALEYNAAGNQSLIDMFYRANERAELTRSHDQHGDTEYRYDIDIESKTITMSVVGYRSIDDCNGTWTKSSFSILEFINKYQ